MLSKPEGKTATQGKPRARADLKATVSAPKASPETTAVPAERPPTMSESQRLEDWSIARAPATDTRETEGPRREARPQTNKEPRRETDPKAQLTDIIKTTIPKKDKKRKDLLSIIFMIMFAIFTVIVTFSRTDEISIKNTFYIRLNDLIIIRIKIHNKSFVRIK